MNALTGSGTLIRLILRRDRIVLPLWVLLLPLVAVGIASGFASLYPTAESLNAFIAGVASSPAETALLGPVLAPTLGGITAWRWSMAGGLLVGLAGLLTVIRHTRSEEEAGRRELVGSAPVGRHSSLTAALIVTFSADLSVGLLIGAGLTAFGLPAAGSFALGLATAGCGLVFTAVGAVAAQLAQHAGAAKGASIAIIGASFLVRAMGDSAGSGSAVNWIEWLSPLGWIQLTRPFAGEVWWIILLFLITTSALTVRAYALSARRDLGAGVIQPRPGRATATAFLRSPLALAWRLQRRTLFTWAAAYAVLGAVIGYIAQTATDQLAANPQLSNVLANMGGTGMSDALFTLTLMIFGGEVAAVYVLIATIRLWSEESAGRADPVMATSVSRVRWAGSHLVVMAAGSAVMVIAFGLMAGLTYGLTTGDVGHELVRILIASLAYLPALWIMAGIAVLFWGVLPRLTALSWVVLGIYVLIDLLGEFQAAGQLVLDLSPFTHVPKLLINQGSTASLVWLIAVAAALTTAGLFAFRRRDMA